MGESLDFIKNRIVSASDLDINNYEKVYEFEFEKALASFPQYAELQTLYKENKLSFLLTGHKQGVEQKRVISIIHDEDANFEYFTMSSCVCDGTLLFLHEIVEEIFYKVFTGQTYNKQNAPLDILDHPWNYDMEYTVGNFVINIKNGDFGTKEKPWLHSKFTAFLPLKCRVIERVYNV